MEWVLPEDILVYEIIPRSQWVDIYSLSLTCRSFRSKSLYNSFWSILNLKYTTKECYKLLMAIANRRDNILFSILVNGIFREIDILETAYAIFIPTKARILIKETRNLIIGPPNHYWRLTLPKLVRTGIYHLKQLVSVLKGRDLDLHRFFVFFGCLTNDFLAKFLNFLPCSYFVYCLRETIPRSVLSYQIENKNLYYGIRDTLKQIEEIILDETVLQDSKWWTKYRRYYFFE